MAGTRLAVISIYVVQFGLLVATAIYLANDSNNSLFGLYGTPMFVNRRGISVLDDPLSSLLSTRLVELRGRAEALRYPLDFCISSVRVGSSDCRADGYCDSSGSGTLQDEDVDVDVDVRMMESLRSGLDMIIGGKREEEKEDIDKRYDSDIDIRVSKPSETRAHGISGTCDDVTSRFGTTDDNDNDPPMTMKMKMTRETLGYDILVSIGCTDTSIPSVHDAKLSVDDSGDMLLSIRDGVSQEDLSVIIRDHVAKFIADEFIVLSNKDNPANANANINGNGKPSWVQSTSTLEVVVTLIDEDPFSYTSAHNITASTNAHTDTNTNTNTPSEHHTNYKHHNHHNRLIQSLTTTVSTYLHPMLQSRLSPLLDNVHLGTQSLPYRQHRPLSSQSVRTNTGYVLGLDHARDAFLNNGKKNAHSSDLSSLVKDKRTTWTAANNVENADDTSATFNFVVLVPPMDRLPMRVKSAAPGKAVSYGTAFGIPERFTAVSIVNLDQAAPVGDDVSGDNADANHHHHHHYEVAVTTALSYFGTFLRQSLGLSPLQPHRKSPSTIDATTTQKGGVILYHIASPYGMTQWEVDILLRTYWRGKAIEILDTLENVLSLLDWKRDIAFTIESAQNVNSCIQHLLHALDSIDGGDNDHHKRDIRRSTRSLNAALRIVTALSVDAEMVGLVHFPWDQLFALIGSLTLPLLMPFIVGMVREYKRYRKLIGKKNGVINA